MKFSISLILLSTSIIASTMVSVEVDDVGYYGSLIKDVYNKYMSAGVITALATKHITFERMTTWHGVTRILSDGGISTLIVDFGQLENRLKFYIEKTNSPLIVIDLDTIEALHSFKAIGKNLDMSYAVWLIFFRRDARQNVCEFCRDPHGNSFNLKFNSKVLILCCDSTMIREWWSVEKNRTESQEVGRFINGNPRIVWSSDESVGHRRHTMDGRVLRVAAMGRTNIFEEKDGNYYGYLGDTLGELSRAMNFTVSGIIWEKEGGIWNSETSNWTGIVGIIHRHEADIGVFPSLIGSERYNAVRYTSPTSFGVYRLYFRKLDAAHRSWSAYFKALAADVWMVIIGLILTTPILIALIKYKRKSHFFSLLCEQYLHVWGIFCQQGLRDSPNESSLKMIYVSIFISAMLASSAYSAFIISSLAAFSSYSPFTTMEQFAEVGTHKLIVIKGTPYYDLSQFSNQKLRMKMKSLMKPRDSLPEDWIQGFEQVSSEKCVCYLWTEWISRNKPTYLQNLWIIGDFFGEAQDFYSIITTGGCT